MFAFVSENERFSTLAPDARSAPSGPATAPDAPRRHHLYQRVFSLSPDELKEVGQCYGHLMDFVSKRVMSPPLPLPQGQLSTSQLPSTVPSTSTARPEDLNTPPTSTTSQNKRKQLLPPSPEQRQKRH